MVSRNTNSPKFRPIRPTSPVSGVGRKPTAGRAGSEQSGPDRRPASMRNRPMPGEVRLKAARGDATLGVRSRYTPIADAVAGRQSFNAGSSMGVTTRPRGINGPRAL